VAGVDLLYSRGADAMPHGARTLPPCATARVPGDAGYSARIPVAVAHGGRNLAPPGSTADRWRHP
jgi:hypothetical protein